MQDLLGVICNFVVSNLSILSLSRNFVRFLSEMSVFSMIKNVLFWSCPILTCSWPVQTGFNWFNMFQPAWFEVHRTKMFYQTVYYLINGFGIFWHGNFGRILGIFCYWAERDYDNFDWHHKQDQIKTSNKKLFGYLIK